MTYASRTTIDALTVGEAILYFSGRPGDSTVVLLGNVEMIGPAIEQPVDLPPGVPPQTLRYRGVKLAQYSDVPHLYDKQPIFALAPGAWAAPSDINSIQLGQEILQLGGPSYLVPSVIHGVVQSLFPCQNVGYAGEYRAARIEGYPTPMRLYLARPVYVVIPP